ncbi:MAG: S16 family serine protease [Methylococcaceae bacterium]
MELHNTGPSNKISLASLIAFCSILLNKPIQERMVVLGDMTLGGVVNPVEDFSGSLQLAQDSGGQRVLLPMASASDIPTVPAEIFSKFQIGFFTDPVDAIYKALGTSF